MSLVTRVGLATVKSRAIERAASFASSARTSALSRICATQNEASSDIAAARAPSTPAVRTVPPSHSLRRSTSRSRSSNSPARRGIAKTMWTAAAMIARGKIVSTQGRQRVDVRCCSRGNPDHRANPRAPAEWARVGGGAGEEGSHPLACNHCVRGRPRRPPEGDCVAEFEAVVGVHPRAQPAQTTRIAAGEPDRFNSWEPATAQPL